MSGRKDGLVDFTDREGNPFQPEYGMSVWSGLNECSTFFAAGATDRYHRKGGMYGRKGKLVMIGKLLLAGMSRRAVARQAGVNVKTVAKMFRILQRELPSFDPRCGCGQPSGHQGWCRVRFNRSPKRQKALAAIHQRQRGKTKKAA